MARLPRLALALAVLLVLAGGTPAAGATLAAEPPPTEQGEGDETTDEDDESEATTESADEEDATTEPTDAAVTIETEGFDPSYDPATVLDRVEELRGLSARQGITLHEYDATEGPDYDMRDEFGAIRPIGAKTLQLYSNASTERRQPLGYTVERQAAVHIYLLNASDLREHNVSQQTVLAHEFVHALQFQHELLTPSRAQFQSEFSRWTTDSRLVTTALVEGDAMRVTEQYLRRYDASDYSVTSYNRTLARSAWPHSVAGTPYYYGYRFYAAVGNSPADRSAAIESPLESTAQLLHPNETVERAPLPDAPAIPDAEKLTRYHADTVGELVVRHALRVNGLSFPRAAGIAEGWANDRMYYYAAAGAAGPATHWVTVWESSEEAREFAEGWRSMLDARGARADGGTLFVPASDHSPGVHYVVERDGATVRITAAEMEDTAERLAETAGTSGATETTATTEVAETTEAAETSAGNASADAGA